MDTGTQVLSYILPLLCLKYTIESSRNKSLIWKILLADCFLNCKMANDLETLSFLQSFKGTWNSRCFLYYPSIITTFCNNIRYLKSDAIESARKQILIRHVPCKHIFFLCMLLSSLFLCALNCVLQLSYLLMNLSL